MVCKRVEAGDLAEGEEGRSLRRGLKDVLEQQHAAGTSFDPGVFECSLFDLKFKQVMWFMPDIDGTNPEAGKVLCYEKHVSETMIDACMDQAFNSR